VDVDYINKLTSKKPTVLVINYSNPWVIDEIYNDKNKGNIKAVLATFGTTAEAVLDVLLASLIPQVKCLLQHPYLKLRHKTSNQMYRAI
jgi:beta-glucosidase